MYIEELKQELTGRKLEIWQGINITPEKAKVYREIWLKQSQKEKPKELPSILSQVTNLTKATAKYIANGFKKVSETDFQARLDVCKTCDRFTDDKRCLECGCYLEVKARWASEDCPLKKWPLPVTVINEQKKGGCGCGGQKSNKTTNDKVVVNSPENVNVSPAA